MMSEELKTLDDKRKLLFKKYRLLDGTKKMILEQDKQFIEEIKVLTYKKYILDIEKHMEFCKELDKKAGKLE